jgi:hypothetical protein
MPGLVVVVTGNGKEHSGVMVKGGKDLTKWGNSRELLEIREKMDFSS